MIYVDVFSPKGGQGCSTLVAVLGLVWSRAGQQVTVLDDGSADLHRIYGLCSPDEVEDVVEVADGLTVAQCTDQIGDRDVVIRDMGVRWSERPLVNPILVVRACYLALSRWNAEEMPRPESVVLVMEPDRALDRKDVEHTIGAPVSVELAVDPAVARLIDAGLLVSRLPERVGRMVHKLSPATVVGA